MDDIQYAYYVPNMSGKLLNILFCENPEDFILLL